MDLVLPLYGYDRWHLIVTLRTHAIALGRCHDTSLPASSCAPIRTKVRIEKHGHLWKSLLSFHRQLGTAEFFPIN